MKQSENFINPYVRLTVEGDKYTLEVMLPISVNPEEVIISENGPLEVSPDDALPHHINYQVRLVTPALFDQEHYTLIYVNLNPSPDSRGIIVSVSPTSEPSPLHGPKADGKTIIQFEDAER